MEKEMIAKVFLTGNGEVHIGLNNYKTVYCTTTSLLDVLINPYEFINEKYLEYEESTRYINEPRKELTELLGITLIRIYNDSTFEVLFPEIFLEIRSQLKECSRKHIKFEHYMYQNKFSNQKQALVKLFLNFVAESNSSFVIDNKIPVSEELQVGLMREIINAGFGKFNNFNNILQFNENEHDDIANKNDVENSTTLIDEPGIKHKKITIAQYAAKHGIAKNTVQAWLNNNRMRTAVKNEKNQWYIDENEPLPSDRRKGRKIQQAGNMKSLIKNGYSYKELQTYINDRKLVTEYTAKFIRTIDEVKYYENNKYHEVEWNGRRALIIDINPNYYSEKYKKTNRELILEGKSPVVPEIECKFHLHHIGQRLESPFSILAENIHQNLFSIFHSGSSCEDLHTKEFEIEKKMFWQTYLKEYDKYGSFTKIPFENSRQKKQERQSWRNEANKN